MKRGVSIMFINGLVVAVVLLFSFGVDVTNRLVHQRYDQTVASQRALIACNNASKVFQQQSDELTLHVNNYVETDSTDALLAYKEKIQEVNHRTVLRSEHDDADFRQRGRHFLLWYGDAYKDALRRVDTALYEMKRTREALAAPCMKNYIKANRRVSGKWGRTVILFCGDFPLYNQGRKKCYPV